MTLSRNSFFVLLFLVLNGPFLGQKLIWLARSKHTTGIVYYIGGTLLPNTGTSYHYAILFRLGQDSIIFNSSMLVRAKEGDSLPLRYQTQDPLDARLDFPIYIWGDTLVYLLSPILIWLVLFLTPDQFDPLIPHHCRIRLGGRRLIKIIPHATSL